MLAALAGNPLAGKRVGRLVPGGLDLLLNLPGDVPLHVGTFHFANNHRRPGTDLLSNLGLVERCIAFLFRPVSPAPPGPHAVARTITDAKTGATAGLSSTALAVRTIHLVAGLGKLVHGVLEHLHLLQLLLQVTHAGLNLIQHLGGVRQLPVLHRLGTLT